MARPERDAWAAKHGFGMPTVCLEGIHEYQVSMYVSAGVRYEASDDYFDALQAEWCRVLWPNLAPVPILHQQENDSADDS
jgi:hypothetical protein